MEQPNGCFIFRMIQPFLAMQSPFTAQDHIRARPRDGNGKFF
jgi:hypothetical protein